MAAIFEDVYGVPRGNVTQRDAGDTGGDGGSEGGAGKQGDDGGAGAGGGAGRGGDTEGDGRADKNPLPSDSSLRERNVRRENTSQQNGGSTPNAISRDVSVAHDLRPESTFAAIGRSRRESVNRSSIGTFSDDATKTVFDGNHNDVASEVDVQKNGAVVGDDVDNLEVDFNLLDDDLDLDQRLVECLQAASDDVGGSTGATWSRGRALEQQATVLIVVCREKSFREIFASAVLNRVVYGLMYHAYLLSGVEPDITTLSVCPSAGRPPSATVLRRQPRPRRLSSRRPLVLTVRSREDEPLLRGQWSSDAQTDKYAFNKKRIKHIYKIDTGFKNVPTMMKLLYVILHVFGRGGRSSGS